MPRSPKNKPPATDTNTPQSAANPPIPPDEPQSVIPSAANPPKPPDEPQSVIPSAANPPKPPDEPQSVTKPVANPPKPPDEPQSVTKPVANPPMPPQIPKTITIETSSSLSGVIPPQMPKKPERSLTSKPRLKSEIPVIEKAIAANGEMFNIGDQIQLTQPYANFGTAIIESFYADVAGEIWAQIKPAEVDSNCRWEQGCIRAERLIKAL